MPDKESFQATQFSSDMQMLKIIKNSAGWWERVKLKYIHDSNVLTYIAQTLSTLTMLVYSAQSLKTGYCKRGKTWPDSMELSGLHALSTVATSKLMRCKGFVSLQKKNLSLG